MEATLKDRLQKLRAAGLFFVAYHDRAFGVVFQRMRGIKNPLPATKNRMRMAFSE